MALSSSQIKDMQSWYGTKADGIWGSKSSAAAGGRDAGSAYSLYSSNKSRYNSYTAYMSYGGGDLRRNNSSGGTQSSSTGTTSSGSGSYSNGGLSDAQIREMQKYYGVTADGKWGKNSTAAAGGLSAADAWNRYKNGGTGSYTPSGSGGTASGGSGGYSNGGLSDAQIREMQNYYGTTPDGKWGKNSTAAAGGLSAVDAWNQYQNSQNAQGSGYGDYGYSGGYDYTGPMSYGD